MTTQIFQPSVVKKEAAARSPLSSRAYNEFQDLVIRDFSRLATVVNGLNAAYRLKVLEAEEERRKNSALLASLRTKQTQEDLQKAVADATLTHTQTFTDLTGLLWTSIDAARRLRIEPAFAQVMLPITQMVSRFGTKDPATDTVYLPETLRATPTAVDEGAGDIIPGNPELALDGMSGEPWIRKVIFPLESNQAEVAMDVDIDVPSLFASNANLLTIVPSPAGEVDILSIKYSTTDAPPTTELPGFTAVEGVSAYSSHFAPLAITKIRVRLRQRHFVTEEHEKVFLYGLKEVGLFLAELDRTNGQATIQNNNIAIFKIDAPAGYTFDKVTGFRSNPVFATGGNDNKIYYKLYSEVSLVNKRWDSFLDATPTIGSPLDLTSYNLSSIYLVVHLEYYTANSVSPVVKSFSFDYTVEV
jgi:hypothetical protein